ncbi:MAG: proton-conducting transporter membrane subunit [Anaerolineaceae bacterium]|nr:proton-conducting transporter membrane subunit [Anaerolineaceae bacterium]
MAAPLILLSIGFPWLGALLVWAVGDTRPRLQHILAVAFAVLAGMTSLVLIPYSSSTVRIAFHLGGAFGTFSFVADGLGAFLAAVATVIGSLAVIFSVDYMKGEAQLGRYYALVLFFIGAMVGLALTGSLLLVFVFWEVTALCSYALISFHNDDPKAVKGGIKALIITQLGGIGLLAGALLAYTYFGTFEINDFLAKAGTLPSGVLATMAFGFLAAAAAKSAQFPFQTWLPDAMEAPTPISALIHAATMVNAGVYLLARFFPAFEGIPGWRMAVMLVGGLSAVMAAVMALVAYDLKRVLAYSTVSQLGYMVYAVGAGGLFASQFHLFSHAIFKALLFLAAGAVIHSVGTRDMRQMGALGKKMPLVRNVFIIGALALAGIPILNGFWSKELVLEAGLHGGPAWLFAVMVFTAGLTALYTFRCVWMVFFGQPRSALHAHEAGTAMRVALIPLALGTFATFLVAGPFAQLLHSTLPYHEIEPLSTFEILTEVLTAPATLLALAVIALGAVAWVWRVHLTGFTKALKSFGQAAANSFGFEAINQGIVNATQQTAEAMRITQTGVLAWNVVGILLGLVAVLIILVWGA